MKSLLVVLVLLTSAPASAGIYYSNDVSATSGTLRVAGVIRVNDPAAPYTSKITINGVNGVVTATTFAGNATTASALAANGANCSAGQYPLGLDASGAVEGCTAAGVGDFVLASANTVTGQTNFSVTTSTPVIIKGWSRFNGTGHSENGTLQIGGNAAYAGIFDYNNSGTLYIDNTYNSSESKILFRLKTQNVANVVVPMSMAPSSVTFFSTVEVNSNGNLALNPLGFAVDSQLEIISNRAPDTQIISVSSQNATNGGMFSILGNGNVGVGVAAPTFRFHVNNAISTAALFNGWSAEFGVAAAGNGSIQIGNNINYSGLIDYSEAGNTALSIVNTYNSATAVTRFRMRTVGGTPVTPISMAGSGVVTINSGANTIYYCNGGANVGLLGRGNGGPCSGGTWTAISLVTD